MPTQAVVLDFDGVIVDSLPILLQVFAEAAAGIGEVSLLSAESLAELHNVTYEEIVRIGGISPERQAEFLPQFFLLFAEHFQAVPLFSGIEQVLQQLAAAVPLAIVSAGLAPIIEKKLEKHGLLSCVGKVYGGDQPGSKTEKILRFAELSGIPAPDIVMVGDSVSDISKGKAAGARTAAVTWGWQPRERLLAMDPDFVFERVDELALLLEC